MTRRAEQAVRDRRGPLTAAAILGLVAALVGLGCEDAAPPPEPVLVTTELTVSWAILPHRISDLELTLARESDWGGTLVARNAGGTFGAIDTPGARYGLEMWQSQVLVARSGSVTIPIPPGSLDEGEPFAAAGVLELEASALAQASVRVALLRGYRIQSDAYDAPPPFASDPDLPYDPGAGFTTQGYGIWLGEPTLVGDRVEVPVRVRNRLGLADRPDMNAALPQATTWVRVDVEVLGVLPAGQGVVTRGEVGYTLGTAEYGQRTDHPHAPAAEQQISLPGAPGRGRALFGLTGFEVWVNVPGHHDPGCVVVQDATNFAGDPVAGPGRYLTALTVRLWDRGYEPASGQGGAKLDLHFTNSSQYHEVGNVCASYAGEVAMVQLEDPEARVVAPLGGALSVTFAPEETAREPVELDPEGSAGGTP